MALTRHRVEMKDFTSGKDKCLYRVIRCHVINAYAIYANRPLPHIWNWYRTYFSLTYKQYNVKCFAGGKTVCRAGLCF